MAERRVAAALFLGLAWALSPCASAAVPPIAPTPQASDASLAGQKVVRAWPRTTRELRIVLGLTDDVWSHGWAVGRPIDVRLTPDALDALRGTGVRHEVLIDDVGARIAQERAEIDAARLQRDASWFATYRTYDEIRTFVQDLAAAHPDLAQYGTIGTTYEERDIFVISITGPGDPTGRVEVLFNGCQHAREWISPMTATYLAAEFIERHATDPLVQAILSRMIIHVVPVANPDGYVHTWKGGNARLWRKNREPNPDGSRGVDLNRNWGVGWGLNSGSSGMTSSETYRGPSPFSEAETRALRDFVLSRPNLVFHVDYHSYGQQILRAWGYTDSVPPDDAANKSVADRMREEILAQSGKSYASIRAHELYPASGVMPDWVYGDRQVWSYGVELRDTGTNGHLLPTQYILPTGQENFAAALWACRWFALPIYIEPFDASPESIAAGEPTVLRFSIATGFSVVTPVSPTIYWRLEPFEPFIPTPMVDLGAGLFAGTLPPVECGRAIEYYVEAGTESLGQFAFPPEGPENCLSAVAIGTTPTSQDSCEIVGLWQVGPGDTATAGRWELADPVGTLAQPEDDRSSPGTKCWVTGASGGDVGANDIDGGYTTLTSPNLSLQVPTALANPESWVRFWLWYSNDLGPNPPDDALDVLLSGDGGQSWVLADRIDRSTSGWELRTYRVEDFLAPAGQIRVRFVASDAEPGAIVEAAVDELSTFVTGCAESIADFNSDGLIDSDDFIAFLGAFAAGDPKADVSGGSPFVCGVPGGSIDSDDFVCFLSLFAGG